MSLEEPEIYEGRKDPPPFCAYCRHMENGEHQEWCPMRPKQGTIKEAFEALREAGGKAWDDVADPAELLGRKPYESGPVGCTPFPPDVHTNHPFASAHPADVTPRGNYSHFATWLLPAVPIASEIGPEPVWVEREEFRHSE